MSDDRAGQLHDLPCQPHYVCSCRPQPADSMWSCLWQTTVSAAPAPFRLPLHCFFNPLELAVQRRLRNNCNGLGPLRPSYVRCLAKALTAAID